MNTHTNTVGLNWYILTGLRHNVKTRTPLKALVEKFNSENGTSLESFAPTFVALREGECVPARVTKSLVCQYVFMRGTMEQVLQFCKVNEDFNMVLNRVASKNKSRYLMISDEAMDSFIQIASVYKYSIPCFSLSEVDLEKGDKVKIVGGPFDGVVGRLESQKGKEGGRVIVKVGEDMAVATYDITPKFIKVLAFAKGSKHIYDVLDSHFPRLRQAVHHRLENGEIDISDAAALQYFITRYGSAEVSSSKIGAKLDAYLMASYYLLENAEKTQFFKEKLEACLYDTVTNEAVLTHLQLLLYMVSRNVEYLGNAMLRVSEWKKSVNLRNALQRAIVDDIELFEKLDSGKQNI